MFLLIVRWKFGKSEWFERLLELLDFVGNIRVVKLQFVWREIINKVKNKQNGEES